MTRCWATILILFLVFAVSGCKGDIMSDNTKRHAVPFGEVGIVYGVPDDVSKELS
ncbi:MAG: hypothetical protein JW782_03390 [Candidatus Saganbacteria bacterium]|nr:hypothetical protein [Candidatus Saganbacteria bacterium]